MREQATNDIPEASGKRATALRKARFLRLPGFWWGAVVDGVAAVLARYGMPGHKRSATTGDKSR